MRPIGTLLVANRGEIARRVFRTARNMGMRCLAVYSDADRDAAFVAEADEAFRLDSFSSPSGAGSGTGHAGSKSGYLDGAALIRAALDGAADAIHPGYGFLSENAGFARAVVAAGLIWVGPEPDVIERSADKPAAKRLAAEAGVPTLAGSDDPGAAAALGFPVIVKAALGGGGKGMRIVTAADRLEDAVAASRREALSSFGDGSIFIERYLARARHVEIQVLGDGQGQLIHLGERECSIQRRHQKIIEECPSPRVDGALRDAMGTAAVSLGNAIGYSSAGTVEFLVDDDTGEFFFLEMNARLQVEHPVTEEVTGIDLVREQLRIAAGEPLGYGQGDVNFTGHAVEARLYAEDPAAGFLPATGTLAAFEPALQPVVRTDSGVESGSSVSVDFDPLLAKVIAHAATRSEATARLALALERLHIGGVRTNRHFLVATLRSAAFSSADTTTDFIERIDPPRSAVLPDAAACHLGVAAALWLAAHRCSTTQLLPELPSGWRHGRLPPERIEFAIDNSDGIEVEVHYRPARDGSFVIGAAVADPGASAAAGGDARARLIPDGRATVHAWSPRSLDLEFCRRRVDYVVTHGVTVTGDELYLTGPAGSATLLVLPRFVPPGPARQAGGFVAPMPGVVLEVRVEPGDQVKAGQTLIVLEAMKMEHHMDAPAAGVVTAVLVAVGDQVGNGAVLLEFSGHDE